MVTPTFSPVPTKPTPPPSWAQAAEPFPLAQLPRLVQSVPVLDARSVTVFWPSPAPFERYHTKPQHVVSWLIGHEGEGSLLSELKRRGWANGLSAGPYAVSETHSLFSIGVMLTAEAVPLWQDVVVVLFQYIALLQAALEADRELAARLRTERDDARKELERATKEVARREQWLDGYAAAQRPG